MPNTVYLLTNPAMPNLVKIGYTTQEDANERVGQLYTTGVPVPFKIEYACKVREGVSAEAIEEALHIAFAPQRVNPRREFFRIEPDQAIAILKLFEAQDTTVEVNQQPSSQIDAESLAAAEQLRTRRPNMNFEEMEIPVGSILHYTEGEATIVVTGPKKVRLGSEDMSISAATRQVTGKDVFAPALYWRFNGKLLRDIYNETYEASS